MILSQWQHDRFPGSHAEPGIFHVDEQLFVFF